MPHELSPNDLRHDIPAAAFTSFNQIVADVLERDAILIYPERKEECPNCYLDTFGIQARSVSIYKTGGPYPFDRGMPCPYCGGRGYKAVEKTEKIRTRIYYDRKYFNRIANSLNLPEGSIQTFTNMTYLTKIEQAKYLIPQYNNIEDYNLTKFEKVGPSIPQGFQQNPVKYVMTFWKYNSAT